MSNKAIAYQAVIGLEVHAELQTASKMFCACPVVDSTQAEANTAVCPVCAGMPGVLPVVNRKAVEFALRVALALECEIAPVSIFARKNYFYPDLPKGYQISQYEQPLARNGQLIIHTSKGEHKVRIRRVHLEEDTGKLIHTTRNGKAFSLVDLNRAGVPLLEIVSEPDLRSAEQVRAYATALRSMLRYLEVNSGDMQKGVLRIEPNVSVRPAGSAVLGTRTEIKNLNSFRSLERSVAYEIERQSASLRQGVAVVQQTLGWDETKGETITQRSKEEAHDYRYFPEPDLPPLAISEEWIAEVRAMLPELPHARFRRFQQQYQLSAYDAAILTVDRPVADYFEAAVDAVVAVPPKTLANWITGELFNLLHQAGMTVADLKITPQTLAALVQMVERGEINQNTGKTVLAAMFETGQTPSEIVSARGLRQISDPELIAELVDQVVKQHPHQLAVYLEGKESLSRWFFGQVMRHAGGKANPKLVQAALQAKFAKLKHES